MLIVIGYFIVLASTIIGFMMAGGHPMVLMHLSEFVIIGGIALGILVIASPKSVLIGLVGQIMDALRNRSVGKEQYLDLLKILYELFMVGRRNGLLALDEHVSSPDTSTILQKYPNFAQSKERVDFLCNALKPIIDGKIKPDQLQPLLEAEIQSMERKAEAPVGVMNLVGDSLPGVGIIAAVLGIINTMGAIADGPEMVGKKVAAALTGTFLGILGAYGFVNPLTNLLKLNNQSQEQYYICMSKAIGAFAKGLAPIMAIELARRSLDNTLVPTADELEQMLRNLNPGK
ncbi:MAG: flagellar motor stator protein MotA [Puniceicoccaceae bacterium]|nr:MAG: flagellar motor stator protein MotA [Puniceicoccaceae bacterium]